ncbi:MAG: type IV pilus twitching motility protein PilT [Planctomycetota bacterium]
MERRVSPRQHGSFVLFYNLTDRQDEPARTAIAISVSVQGVFFKTEEYLPIGTELSVELTLPSKPDPVSAMGWVNRIEEAEDDDGYCCSVLFTVIAKSDTETLQRYLRLVDVENLMRLAVKKRASDIHLIANRAPVMRIEGKLRFQDMPPLAQDDLHSMITSMMTDMQQNAFKKNLELDFSYHLPEGVRFRVNVHLEKGYIEAALRLIPAEIPTIEKLNLPVVLKEFCKKGKGLFIVSGPTGSGKSTTLAAMIDEINRTRDCMIISIEDPIEYVHESDMSIIKQREVGSDTLSFNNALKHVLRQDPDVILVGEIRDLESISMAITAAETGHLVLTTLHTLDAAECINRIVDVYPSEQQDQVRSQLAGCLEGIMAQLLLPRANGQGRVLATEVLVGTQAIRSIIREGKLGQIHTYMEAGGKYGMHTLDSSLLNLVESHKIERGLARGFARNPKKFAQPHMNP